MIRQSIVQRLMSTAPVVGARPKLGTSTVLGRSRPSGAGELAGGTDSVLPLAAGVGAAASVGATGFAGAAVGVEAPASVGALGAPFVLADADASEPAVSEEAAPEVSVAAPVESVMSGAAAEVSGAAAEVSGAAAEVSAVSVVALSEAGGGGSARAVATKAEAQREAATRATTHRRALGDRPSPRGSWMLRMTQLPSSTTHLTMACVRFLEPPSIAVDIRYASARNAGGSIPRQAADVVSSSARG